VAGPAGRVRLRPMSLRRLLPVVVALAVLGLVAGDAFA
jgi:hypothetical protein